MHTQNKEKTDRPQGVGRNLVFLWASSTKPGITQLRMRDDITLEGPTLWALSHVMSWRRYICQREVLTLYALNEHL